MREHILSITDRYGETSNEAFSDATDILSRDVCLYRVANLIECIDALRSDLSAAEHLLNDATTGATQVNEELAALRNRLADAEAVIAESKRWLAVRDNWSAPISEIWYASERLAKTIRIYSTREAAEAAKGKDT